MAATFPFLHHRSGFALAGAPEAGLAASRVAMTSQTARRIPAAGAVYGLCAARRLVVGLLRVPNFKKAAAHDVSAFTVHARSDAFMLFGMLSIVPTIAFLSWRRALRAGQTRQPSPARSKGVRLLVPLALLGLVAILAFAAMMARGTV